MRLETVRRRRSVVGLTSLIDVIFLLLLFFMLSSTFSRYSQLDLGVAATGSGGSGERPKLLISVAADEPIRLNGRATDETAIQDAIASFVGKGVETAVVVPRGDVQVQRLVVVLEQLRATGLKSVSLAD